jgi:hypothetical protein
MKKKYSHIVCIGDSLTEEYQYFQAVGLDKVFKEIGYEFKSYPQILAEFYDCEYMTFGGQGKTMTHTIQDFIKSINTILKLENPLVLYQFGYFMNGTLKLSKNIDFIWKDVVDMDNLDHINASINVDKDTELLDNVSELDKLSIVNWFEKYEEYRNYYFIEYFLSLTDHIKAIKDIDIYAFFVTPTLFTQPKHDNLLWLFDDGYGYSGLHRFEDSIYHYIKHLGLHDGHKSTEGNLVLAKEIKKQVDLKNKLD